MSPLFILWWRNLEFLLFPAYFVRRHFIDCRWESDSKWWLLVPSAIICDIMPALRARYSWKRCLRVFFIFYFLWASLHILDIDRTRNMKYRSSYLEHNTPALWGCNRVPSLTPWRILSDITAVQMWTSRGLSRIHAPSLGRLNLLKLTGYVMYQQFNIQQLYVLPTLYLCVLYLSENKQRLVPFTA